MRKLELVISVSKGALPVVLAATVVSATSVTCSSTTRIETSSSSSGTGGSAGDGASGGGTGGGAGGTGGSGGIIFPSSSSGSSGGGSGGASCPGWTEPYTFVVNVPPAGTPAEPGQICAISMDPVSSNKAARVTLTKSPMGNHLATGFVAIDPALLPSVIGIPTISVMAAGDAQLKGMQVTNIMLAPGGFSFDAQWPLPFDVEPYGWTNMTIKTTFVLGCDPQAMTVRVVEALTYVNLCIENKELAWVSSGDTCNACESVAEMAPSPIVPDKQGDDLPLGRALRLRIVALARIGASVILFAENDGGDGLAYTWHPSAGRIEQIANDIVMWTPPSDFGEHIVQVAVHEEEAAAVATFSWRDAA